MRKPFLHEECNCIHRLRILKTPENEFVFDTFYNETLWLSDGTSYNTLEECINNAIKFITKLSEHEITHAIIC